MIPSDMNTKTKEYAASFLSKASDHEYLDAYDSFFSSFFFFFNLCFSQ